MPDRHDGRQRTGGADPSGVAAWSDEALVQRAREGDLDAFTALVERYQVAVYNLCLRLTNQPADAADAAQEVFLRVYTNLRRFQGRGPFRSWVYRIAVNTCRDELRRRRRRPVPALAPPGPDAHPLPAGDDGDPARAVVGREVQAAIQDALGRLPEVFRTVVVLRDVEGLSYEEVAAVLGVSIGTVKSRVHRGRVMLRDWLAAAGWLAGRGKGGDGP
ncbi:RNA polymerase, sigma-24 subunit, ECF subfamily [Thermaerobacter marianensis DSM 12885]|uniref:RNA polymerase, sigma-24 subunit, ECF subfamily n=1 Tax=Thermaerobacter marianensis (strain ATCC 700841 / DSM 12885 / JCM 10246 / 7p75a) TaxID=644966 RepID=E6SGI9_THEM7|nr:sigma-70 family RNA polymerase sigma factor [Thermaerobacter marianensis]ADU50535.1 RNA polymerase, sigma-24 subunit, ECF subfamily [Thermaerobacter marianensis DSM 12885]